MLEAGLPEGVLNVVHGDQDVVEANLAHPLIKAVSFVGYSDIAQQVYARGAAHAKRMQCMVWATKHGRQLPDAYPEQVWAAPTSEERRAREEGDSRVGVGWS